MKRVGYRVLWAGLAGTDKVWITVEVDLPVHISTYKAFPGDVKQRIRDALWELQGHVCYWCRRLVRPDTADHDPRTGLVRGLVHDACNEEIARVDKGLQQAPDGQSRYQS